MPLHVEWLALRVALAGSDGWIAARVYRRDDGPLDTAWLEARLDAAAASASG